MNKLIFRGLIALMVWTMASCSDDDLDSNALPDVGADKYYGACDLVTLKESMSGFRYADFICEISAESGELIRRKGSHVRIGGLSELRFDVGLCPGNYRLRCLLAPEVDPQTKDTTWVEYGLGCLIELGTNIDSTVVKDPYDEKIGLYGKGTKECPYQISCGDNLKSIRKFTNTSQTNRELKATTYFLQTNDIDMERASSSTDRNMGWVSIGNANTCPFRGIYDGNGYTISNLKIKRPTFSENACVGLFGFAESANFKHVTIKSAKVTGNTGVGALLGCAVTVGDYRPKVSLSRCVVEESKIESSTDGFAAGGLVGMVDYATDIMLDSCFNVSTEVTGHYCVGGLLGAGGKYSRTIVRQCSNRGDVTAQYTGTGGIVGAVDSLIAVSCVNYGKIKGAQQYSPQQPDDEGCLGTGGIAGGSGTGYAVACGNEGEVIGHTGVGGIIGSSRIFSDIGSNGKSTVGMAFSDISVQACTNKGHIKGYTSVGGLVGEAQLECRTVYNEGLVEASYKSGHLGGIAGNTSIAVFFDVLNNGQVSGTVGSAGGLIGKTNWGNVYGCQNFAEVSNDGKYIGGLIGLAGNYTLVDYCNNMGQVNADNANSAGGIIGEMGDARNWSANDKALCVLGAADIALGFASPLISCAGEVLEGAQEFSYLAKFFHVLHISETIIDGSLIAYDIGFTLGWDIFKMLTEEEIEASKAELHQLVETKEKAVKAEIKNRRDKYAWEDALTNQLSIQPLKSYWSNFQDISDALDSKEVVKNVNYHMNEVRNNRLGELKNRERKKQIEHKIVTGVCVLVSSISMIIAAAGVLPSGGATAPLVAIIGGSFPSVIGGANAIIEGVENYQQNVVVVSQCLNKGKLNTKNTKNVGGLIGYYHQNCVLSNSMNVGHHSSSGDKGGGMMGYASAASEVTNCLNVGSGWNQNGVASANSKAHFNNNFYFNGNQNTDEADPDGAYADAEYADGDEDSSAENGKTETAKGLKLSELCDYKKYSNWEIAESSQQLWYVEPWNTYYPTPYKSAMQKEYKK